MKLPEIGYSNQDFEWFSASNFDDAFKLGIKGFHVLTEKGRDIWLALHSKKFTEMNPKLKEFIEENNLSFKQDPATIKFQAVNLVINIKGLALSPHDLDLWQKKVGIQSRDVIQAVNKTEQWGLANFRPRKSSKQVWYYFPQPFKLAEVYLHKQPIKDPNNKTEKENQVVRIKRWIREHILDLDVSEWDIGHMDPLRSDKFVYQSRKYQRALKNKFKFDENGLVKCPTIEELKSNLDDYYSSKQELEELLYLLKRKLGK